MSFGAIKLSVLISECVRTSARKHISERFAFELIESWKRNVHSAFRATMCVCSNYSPPDKNCLRLRCNVIDQQQQNPFERSQLTSFFLAWSLTSFMMRADKVIRPNSNAKSQENKYVYDFCFRFILLWWGWHSASSSLAQIAKQKRFIVSHNFGRFDERIDTLAMNFRSIRIEMNTKPSSDDRERWRRCLRKPHSPPRHWIMMKDCIMRNYFDWIE